MRGRPSRTKSGTSEVSDVNVKRKMDTDNYSPDGYEVQRGIFLQTFMRFWVGRKTRERTWTGHIDLRIALARVVWQVEKRIKGH